MEILKRIALIAHWVGFVCASFLGLLFMVSIFTNSDLGWLAFLMSIFSFFSCSGLGWLVRFVLIGKVHFLPWKTPHN
jgi:hypothetical protein